MDMSYRKAWMLVRERNETLGTAVVEIHKGGTRGGGAELTRSGRQVIGRYRAVEKKAAKAGAEDIVALESLAKRNVR
jgi:molybdate transport system regulatory protein